MSEKITTYNAAVSYLNDTPRFTEKHTIEQTRQMLELLGRPDRAFHIIHTAGTNGKGSVCTAVSSILCAAGYKTGLFTSPHLITARERFAIDGKMISEEAFLEDFLEVRKMLENHPACDHPTYFEYLFLMAMLRFRKEGVFAAVLETGLGGRLDATNAAERPDVCIITSIGLDHTEYLGETIEEIAAEKAGIIKPSVPVFYDGGKEASSRVIENEAAEKGAPAYRITERKISEVRQTEKGIAFICEGRYDRFHLESAGPAQYQVMNLSLAACAAEWFLKHAAGSEPGGASCAADRTDDHWVRAAVETGISRFRMPGRMECKGDGIFLDGAHNPDGTDAFLKSVRAMCGSGQILIFACMKDKNGFEMVRRIAQSGLFAVIIVTGADSPRAADPAQLAAAFRALTKAEVLCIPEAAAALRTAADLKKSGQYVFAAGSLYLAGELEKRL